MTSELLVIESTLFFTSFIALLIFKELETNQKIIKILFSLSNISIFLLEIKQIGDSNYVLLAISCFLMSFYFYMESKTQRNKMPQIQVLNTQLSERNNRVESEIELPQQLPVIPSFHESNSSMNWNQNPLTTENNRRQSNLSGEKNEPQNSKQELNFLGDQKRPSIQQKNHGPGTLITRQQSVAQIQPNLNVIKFQDDFGEIKFGILKTLKSVAYDQLGKEVECIFQTDRPLTKLLSTVEQTSQPRMQILYESQVQNKYVDDTLRGAIKLDDIGYNDKQVEKKITWQKIIKALILIIILNINLVIIENWNLNQLTLIFMILWRQILQYKKLIANSLEVKCESREILIWLAFITFPMFTVLIINLIINKTIGKLVLQIASWVTLIITSKYNKNCEQYLHVFLLYIFVLTIILCFI